MRRITYNANGESKLSTNIVASICGLEVRQESNEIWDSTVLKVPNDSIFTLSSKLISVRYTLELCLTIPMWSNLEIEFPITIGTVPAPEKSMETKPSAPELMV